MDKKIIKFNSNFAYFLTNKINLIEILNHMTLKTWKSLLLKTQWNVYTHNSVYNSVHFIYLSLIYFVLN
jgi:hypothetical protein